MNDILSLWWVWICAALVLGLVELLAPAFIFLGFALGAIAMAGLMAMNIAMSLSVKLAIYAVLSLLGWVALKRYFRPPAGNVQTFENDIND